VTSISGELIHDFFIVLEPKASKGHHDNFAFIFGDVQCSYDKLARYVR